MSYNMAFSYEMNQKAKDAAVKYLEKRGHQILERDCKFDIVSKDEKGSVVFADVFLQNTTEEMPLSRIRIEGDMLRELVNHGEWTDCPVRYDTIIVVPLGTQALIKYHLNAIGFLDCEDD